MKTAIVGYPRIGAHRELKFASEQYFRGTCTEAELQETAKALRLANLTQQKESGLDWIPSNDFSFYDGMLDTAFLLNAVPKRYRELGLAPLDTYFAAARGYQGDKGDVKALAMKKWFNTNYHYMVPELEDDTAICLADEKPFRLYQEAKAAGVETKPVVIGAYTFLKLAVYNGKKTAADFVADTVKAYADLLQKFQTLGTAWVQFDEPCLVMDMTAEDKALFTQLYAGILAAKGSVKVLLQTYFGDVRDCYDTICKLDVDGIGLDFLEGKQSAKLVTEQGFPNDKILFAGVVNGKNIWKNHYDKTLSLLAELSQHAEQIVLNTSCSLLHVPYTTANEHKLSEEVLSHFAYDAEKLTELKELKQILSADHPQETAAYQKNAALFATPRSGANKAVQEQVAALKDADFVRLPAFAEREQIQKKTFGLPLLPTTTIGSFPQTAAVRANRAAFRKGEISQEQYDAFNKQQIADCVALQEKIGLDVLVHGEFERNDMVEYFGESLDGYVFTKCMGAVLRYSLRKAAGHLGRCKACKANDGKLVCLCTEPDKKADEGYADWPSYDFELVVPERRHLPERKCLSNRPCHSGRSIGFGSKWHYYDSGR